MIVEMRIEAEFLHVTVAGKFSMEEAKSKFLEVLDTTVQHKIKKVLFDARDLTALPGTLDLFSFATFGAEEVLRCAERSPIYSAPRLALIFKPPLDEVRFGENVAANRGVAVKMFCEPEDAMKWLGLTQKPTGKS
jgi:hypothetical protein